MAIQITIQVPDALGAQLQQVQDRLPEVLERGLRDLQAASSPGEHDARAIIDVLASQPTPDEVLALRPSAAMQQRASMLLDRSKGHALSVDEATELERYLVLEHLVRLAKARAFTQQTGR